MLRISVGGWFELYDLFMAAYISLGMFKEGLFTPTGTGIAAFASFVAAGFAGMFVGTLAFGWISDRFGRRSTFAWSLVWYSLATAAMAFMPSAGLVDAFRLLAGIGIGVQIITIDAYIAEITPAEWRGRMIALSQLVSYTAVPVVAALAALLVPHHVVGLAGWRIVALIGALGALFALPVRAGLPESERRLTSRAGRREPTSPRVAGYGARTVMLVVFNFFQTIGYYGFASWVPILLFQEGVAYVHALTYVMLIALANPLGPIAALYAADRYQRKWQIVTLALAIAVLGLLFAEARAAALIVLVGMLITLANSWFSSAFHAYQAELYPTRVRAAAVGFVYSWSRFSAIFAGYWIALALGRFGVRGVFVLIAAAMCVSAAIVAALGSRTNQLALETISP